MCSNAQVANMPYRQDIHYYGVATDAAYLKPFCEGQSQGNWLKPEPSSQPVEGQDQATLARRELRRAMNQSEAFVAMPLLAFEQCHVAAADLLDQRVVMGSASGWLS